MSKKISFCAYLTPARRHGMMDMAPSPSVSDTLDALPSRKLVARPRMEGGVMSVASALGSVIIGYPLSSISSSS